MSGFGLKIIATNRVFYEGRAKFIVLPQSDGEIAVMAGHEDAMIAIVPGELRYQTEDSDEWHLAAVSGGFAQVINNRVTVLVLTAETPEEIDERRAMEAKEIAQEQLRQKMSQHQYYRTQASLSRAMSRLKVKEHSINH